MDPQTVFTAHPKDAAQVDALKAFMEALNIKFEVTESEEKPYRADFVAKIKKSQRDYQEGKGTKVTLDELDNLWK